MSTTYWINTVHPDPQVCRVLPAVVAGLDRLAMTVGIDSVKTMMQGLAEGNPGAEPLLLAVTGDMPIGPAYTQAAIAAIESLLARWPKEDGLDYFVQRSGCQMLAQHYLDAWLMALNISHSSIVAQPRLAQQAS